MPKLSSQSATCWVAELRWAAALVRPFCFNALLCLALTDLLTALERSLGSGRGIVAAQSASRHRCRRKVDPNRANAAQGSAAMASLSSQSEILVASALTMT